MLRKTCIGLLAAASPFVAESPRLSPGASSSFNGFLRMRFVAGIECFATQLVMLNGFLCHDARVLMCLCNHNPADMRLEALYLEDFTRYWKAVSCRPRQSCARKA